MGYHCPRFPGSPDTDGTGLIFLKVTAALVRGRPETAGSISLHPISKPRPGRCPKSWQTLCCPACPGCRTDAAARPAGCSGTEIPWQDSCVSPGWLTNRDRTRVAYGKSVSVRVVLGGRMPN